ncbi:hypothetical protein [Chondromyces crocatus]|uniref:Secreted protein n=1 Tax=Chondromyces crocatus TaxID=52 RepID=A0A0K1E7W4_CHOCO|nr:hypothetical protein [Chondromyces crocatus]AKT36772.1 uncharacterized protein CMC5_008930 [Chondromyces crocatus]
MRRLATPPALLLAAMALGSLGFACGSEGTTLDCENNVGQDGITPSAEGCQQFATCPDGEPANCCERSDAPSSVGEADFECWQVRCLYGYGVRTSKTAACFGHSSGGSGGSGGSAGGDSF